jgi:hypothetical protein
LDPFCCSEVIRLTAHSLISAGEAKGSQVRQEAATGKGEQPLPVRLRAGALFRWYYFISIATRQVKVLASFYLGGK